MNWFTKEKDQKKEKRFCISKNKVKVAHKNETGAGYYLKKKTSTGFRKVPIASTIFKSEEDAKKRILSQKKTVKSGK